MRRDASLVPLSHQHQHALALCVQIDRSLAAGITPDALATLCTTIVRHFDSERRQHFEVEERVLFPVMSVFETTRHMTDDLIGEHRTLETLRDRLSHTPAPSEVATFSQLLRSHVRKEEGELFEAAQQLLSPEELADLGRKLGVQEK
jgi:hemerythrin-like domain-containing protein